MADGRSSSHAQIREFVEEVHVYHIACIRHSHSAPERPSQCAMQRRHGLFWPRPPRASPFAMLSHPHILSSLSAHFFFSRRPTQSSAPRLGLPMSYCSGTPALWSLRERRRWQRATRQSQLRSDSSLLQWYLATEWVTWRRRWRRACSWSRIVEWRCRIWERSGRFGGEAALQ